jgi:hypothetical protein
LFKLLVPIPHLAQMQKAGGSPDAAKEDEQDVLLTLKLREHDGLAGGGLCESEILRLVADANISCHHLSFPSFFARRRPRLL